jgi:uncharacterized membrane protein YfcA
MFHSLIFLGSLIAGALDTVVGFGGVLLLLPVLVLVVGSKDAVLLSALIPLGWNLTRTVMMPQLVNWRTGGLMALGIVPGSIIGAQFLDTVNPDLLRKLIGGVLLLFGLYYVLRLYFDLPQPRAMKSWTIPVFGAVAGAVSSLIGAGNGPIQAWGMAAAGLGAREIAVTGGALGAVNAAARLIGYGVDGELHAGLWMPGAVGIVAAVLGSLLGIRLSMRAKDSTLELVIGVVIILAGLRMFWH